MGDGFNWLDAQFTVLYSLLYAGSGLFCCFFASQSGRETKAASHVLQTVWAYKDLRNSLYKGGWNKSHFKV